MPKSSLVLLVVDRYPIIIGEFFRCKNFWQQFGTFVKDHASPINNPEELLFHSTTTVYNYFGMAKERIRLIYPENPILVGHELEKGTSNSDGWFSRIKDMVRDHHIASKRTFRSMENN
jgi:hypothetical protein